MMTTKSPNTSNRDDLISAAQYEGIKLAPPLSHAQLVTHELIDEEVWYQVVVQPKPVTVIKHAQTVSFQRKPYTVYRRYEDFQCFTHQLCEEFEQHSDLLRQLSTCIGAAFDNEFDQNITQEQRQEDLGTFLVQLFETSHIVLTSRPVMEFLGRWHTDDDLSLRGKQALHQMRRPRNQRARSLNDLRSAMKQHAAQMLNKPMSKTKPFTQGHRTSKSGSSNGGIISLSRQSSEGDRGLMSSGGGSHGLLPPFNLSNLDNGNVSADEEPSKARMRKVRSFTHVRTRVSSLFTGKRSGGDEESNDGGNSGGRRSRHSRRGSEGSALAIKRTSSGQHQMSTPNEDTQLPYGLPTDFKLPDLDTKQNSELLSDFTAIFQQNNVTSPQGEPSLADILHHNSDRRRGKGSNNSSVDLNSSGLDQYLPSSMKRSTNTTSPLGGQSTNSGSTSTLARFLAQAAAHRESCSNSPVQSLGNLSTPHLSSNVSSAASSTASFKFDASQRRQSIGTRRKSMTNSNGSIFTGKSDINSFQPASLGSEAITVMTAALTINGGHGVPMARSRSAGNHRRDNSFTGSIHATPIPERSPQRGGTDARRSALVTNGQNNNLTVNNGPSHSQSSSDAQHVIVIVRVDSTREVRLRLVRNAQFAQLRNALWKEVSRIPGLAERMSGRLLLCNDPNQPDGQPIRVVNDNALQRVMALVTNDEIALYCSKTTSNNKPATTTTTTTTANAGKDINADLPTIPSFEISQPTENKPLPPSPLPPKRSQGKGAFAKIISAFTSSDSNSTKSTSSNRSEDQSNKTKPLPMPPTKDDSLEETKTTLMEEAMKDLNATKPTPASPPQATTIRKVSIPSNSEVPLTPALIEQLQLSLPRGSFSLMSSTSAQQSALAPPSRIPLLEMDTPETPVSPPVNSWYRLSEHLESYIYDDEEVDNEEEEEEATTVKIDVPVSIDQDVATVIESDVMNTLNKETMLPSDVVLESNTVNNTLDVAGDKQELVTSTDRRPSITLESAAVLPNNADIDKSTAELANQPATKPTLVISTPSNAVTTTTTTTTTTTNDNEDITLTITPVSRTASADSSIVSPSLTAPWMDPDLAHKLGLNNVSQDSLSTSDNTTAVTEQPKDRVANRMTSSFSSAFSFMSNKEQNDTDNQSLAVDGNDSTFKTRFQTAASGFVSSFSIRRANSLMSMARNKAGTSEGDTSNTAAETTTTDGTTTTAATAIATSSTNHGSVAADAMVAESVTVVPPPRLSSKTNMEPADGKKKELTKAQKLKNKRSFLEQLRQAQVEEEEQLKAEAALADQAEGTDTATAAASEEAAPTSGARRLLHKMRSESRLLVTKQAPDTSRLDITVQLDDRQHFLLQAMRNVEYASLRASIWAELIRRQMPETLFAGKALVYRGTHGELTVSGDGPLREAVDDCLDGGNSHLVFHCI